MSAILGAALGGVQLLGGTAGAIGAVKSLVGGGSSKKEQYWTPERVYANYTDVWKNRVNISLDKLEGALTSAKTSDDVALARASFDQDLVKWDSVMVESHMKSPLKAQGLAEATIQRVRQYGAPILQAGQQEASRMVAARQSEIGGSVSNAVGGVLSSAGSYLGLSDGGAGAAAGEYPTSALLVAAGVAFLAYMVLK